MEDTPDALWLDSEFIVQVLQSVDKDTNKAVEVCDWMCEPAVPPGNNHLSLLFRVTVDYRTSSVEEVQSTTFIVKAPLPPGGGREYVDSFRGTEREVLMYKEVLPRMYRLYNFCGTPRSYPSPVENIIIMEDLRRQGYKMADRKKQLDFHHSREYLLSLSKLHAHSVAIYHEDPDLIKNIGFNKSFTEDADDAEDREAFWKDTLERLINKVKGLERCERFVEKIRSGVDSFYSTVVNIFRPSTALNVLNHGDPWTNNIMFKYNDSGEIIDSKLVDFQDPRFCSFAADLMVMWWSSANEDVREHHQKELFELYRQNLNVTLKEVGCSEEVSKEVFDQEIKKCAPYALRMASVLLGVATSSQFLVLLPKALEQMEAFGVFI